MKSNKKKTLRRILSSMKDYRFLIAASLGLALMTVILTLYVPILTGRGVDMIVARGQVDFPYHIRLAE